MVTLPTLRVARSSELATLIAIDDDASSLFIDAGFVVDLAPEHPFVVGERSRWDASLQRGNVWVATDENDLPVGFAALGVVDGAAYLDQLSVVRSSMGRGVGSALLVRAIAWAREQAMSEPGLWLDTYGHLSWNRPFYERRGFRVVPEIEWRSEIRAVVEDQRACLPHPDRRVVMVYLA